MYTNFAFTNWGTIHRLSIDDHLLKSIIHIIYRLSIDYPSFSTMFHHFPMVFLWFSHGFHPCPWSHPMAPPAPPGRCSWAWDMRRGPPPRWWPVVFGKKPWFCLGGMWISMVNLWLIFGMVSSQIWGLWDLLNDDLPRKTWKSTRSCERLRKKT